MGKGDLAGIGQGTDQIGIQTGFGAEKFTAGADIVGGVLVGHIRHQPYLGIGSQRTAHGKSTGVGGNAFVVHVGAVHDLERQLFVGEHDKAVLFGFGLHGFVDEALFQRRHHFHLQGNHNTILSYSGKTGNDVLN